MIEVIIDMIPYGIQSKRRVISKIKIVNTGTNERRPEYGDYKVSFYSVVNVVDENDYNVDKIAFENPVDVTHIKDFKRSQGIHVLLQLILEKYNNKE